MLSHYLQSVQGIEVVGTLLLVISLIAFLAVVVWSIKADKEYVRTMSKLPLNDDSDSGLTFPKVHQ